MGFGERRWGIEQARRRRVGTAEEDRSVAGDPSRAEEPGPGEPPANKLMGANVDVSSEAAASGLLTGGPGPASRFLNGGVRFRTSATALGLIDLPPKRRLSRSHCLALGDDRVFP